MCHGAEVAFAPSEATHGRQKAWRPSPGGVRTRAAEGTGRKGPNGSSRPCRFGPGLLGLAGGTSRETVSTETQPGHGQTGGGSISVERGAGEPARNPSMPTSVLPLLAVEPKLLGDRARFARGCLLPGNEGP